MSAFHKKIVVWERSNKLGKWCPYSADICQLFEEKHKDTLSVCLGDVNNDLKIYSVNFKDMIQISEATGTKLPIRRLLCDTLSVFGRGFSWQWLDDHDNWNTYDTDVNDYIDNAFLEGKRSVSLGRKFPGYNYEIIFSKMSQMNRRSKRKRKVRRQENSSPYPTVDSSDDFVDSDKKDHVNEVQGILSPEFLAQEIPGTSSLVNQVNTYKRNVESPVHIDDSSIDLTQNEDDGLDCSEHLKFSAAVEQDKQSNLVPSSSVVDNPAALVNGKPYFDSKPPHTPQFKIKPVPGIDPLPKVEKPKRTRKKGRSNVQTQEVVSTSILDQYTELVDMSSAISAETCIICCESLSSSSSYNDDKTVSKLTLCSHMFHKACLEAMYNSSNKEFLQCPSCKKIYGEKCGIQPPGEMIYHVLPYSLPGYPENDTIRIIYDIKSGVQGPDHPNPGKGYTTRGFPRHCFLPDNEMGRKILRLLIKAWKRRLIFTIGRSSTTGEEDTVTWNEIHHKTEFGCNRRGHGYPDPNYFNNVLEELEAQGVIDDEARIWYPA